MGVVAEYYLKSRWDAEVKIRFETMKTLPSSLNLRAVRPALFTAGGSEGFLLTKIMTIKTIDGELSSFPYAISIKSCDGAKASFLFYETAEVDWLINQLQVIRSNVQSLDKSMRGSVNFIKPNPKFSAMRQMLAESGGDHFNP